MKKILALLLLFFCGTKSFAQSDFEILNEKEKLVYKGRCTFEDLLREVDFRWMKEGVESYKPNARAIHFLQKNLGSYDIVVLMGTWCGDSQDLLPPFYKTLKLCGYPMSQLKMYGLNRAKEAKHDENKTYQVTNIPVFILYKDNQEIGRITESVQKSIEQDLVDLIKKKS